MNASVIMKGGIAFGIIGTLTPSHVLGQDSYQYTASAILLRALPILLSDFDFSSQILQFIEVVGLCILARDTRRVIVPIVFNERVSLPFEAGIHDTNGEEEHGKLDRVRTALI